MNPILKIDKALNTPVYQQIILSVQTRIKDGGLVLGSQLPSINQVAHDYNLARETVVKAFKILQERGIISPVQGKGYFVSSVDFDTENRIFLLFDALSAYKEVIYSALKDRLGAEAFIDIYYHHFNFRMFEKLVRESVGNYQSYIVLPIENERLDEVLGILPAEKLYLLDIKPESSSKSYPGIYQNFESDIFQALSGMIDLCGKYRKLFLVFRNQITDPPLGLIRGFNRFCKTNGFESIIIRTSLSKRKIDKGEGYIVIDDEDLVYLVEYARRTGLEIGSDLGIVSYNETPLKKIAANGISVLSTDFYELGCQIAEMVINNEKSLKYNSFRFINRNSF
jgi:DNA-binding transcriptional regulator YhcF (GntR family)